MNRNRRKIIGILAISLSLFSCNNEPDSQTIKNGVFTYFISEANFTGPIDLNFDGMENLKMQAELLAFDKIVLYIIERADYGMIQIIWPEPLIDNHLLQELPLIYTETMSMEYVPVKTEYYYTLSKDRKTMYTDENDKVVIDKNKYTFSFPQIVHIEGNRLKFQTKQKFLTKKGVEERLIDAVFTAATEKDLFK